jgi:hypothetical protein
VAAPDVIEPLTSVEPLGIVVPLVPPGAPVPTPDPTVVPDVAAFEPLPPLPLFATVSGCGLPLPQPTVIERARPMRDP